MYINTIEITLNSFDIPEWNDSAFTYRRKSKLCDNTIHEPDGLSFSATRHKVVGRNAAALSSKSAMKSRQPYVRFHVA